jgi:hypothetical protein
VGGGGGAGGWGGGWVLRVEGRGWGGWLGGGWWWGRVGGGGGGRVLGACAQIIIPLFGGGPMINYTLFYFVSTSN